MANSHSRRDRQFVQAAAMLFPSEITQVSRICGDITTYFSRRLTAEH
jgi:hypothetical protein